MISALVRVCVPLLGDAVFVDSCEDGLFVGRVAAVHAPQHAVLGAALEAQASHQRWRDCVERVVMTKSPLFDPLGVLALGGGIPASAIAVVPLVARGKILGVFGVVRTEELYSYEELLLARAIARRIAYTMDDARASERRAIGR